MNQDSGEDGWWRFLALIIELESTDELNDFFDLFLTVDEKEDLAGRYLIIRDLLKGERTQREMADELQVSIAKITRGSNGLKRIGDELKSFLLERI